MAYHHRNTQLIKSLTDYRQTNQAASVHRHEVNGLRGHLVGGNGQITLIFSVFIIDDDEEFALFNVLNCLRYR